MLAAKELKKNALTNTPLVIAIFLLYEPFIHIGLNIMRTARKPSLRIFALGFMLSLFSVSVFADKPYWANGNHHQGHQYRSDRAYDYRDQRYNNNKHYNNRRYDDNQRRNSVRYGFYNNDRRLINQYYRQQQYQGQCPRGLIKKHNRCQPKGYNKKWHKGKPLAKSVKYYPLPKQLNSRMQQSAGDYRYVRVDDNILMVDAITDIVVDAIENILR